MTCIRLKNCMKTNNKACLLSSINVIDVRAWFNSFQNFYMNNFEINFLKNILFEVERQANFFPKFLRLLHILSVVKSGETTSGDADVVMTSRHQTVQILSYFTIVRLSSVVMARNGWVGVYWYVKSYREFYNPVLRLLSSIMHRYLMMVIYEILWNISRHLD